MYKNLICLILPLVLLADAPLPNAQSRDDDWQLVFSDEFDQPNGSRPDAAKWATPQRLSDVRWRRWISSSPEVAYVKNGSLILKAVPHRPADGDTAKIWTGAVDTRKAFLFTYGKIEARMKTNFKEGNSPAFWLQLAPSGKDFLYSEIDIVEVFGKRGRAEHAAHTHQTYTLKKQGPQNKFSEQMSVTKWHVYGLEWTEDYLRWTVDGETMGIYRRSMDKQQIAEGQWPFYQPLYIILNQSLYGVSTISQTYETRVDWVRVYQRKRE